MHKLGRAASENGRRKGLASYWNRGEEGKAIVEGR